VARKALRCLERQAVGDFFEAIEQQFLQAEKIEWELINGKGLDLTMPGKAPSESAVVLRVERTFEQGALR